MWPFRRSKPDIKTEEINVPVPSESNPSGPIYFLGWESHRTLILGDELDTAMARALRQNMSENLKRSAVQHCLVNRMDDLVIRELLPRDCGLRSWKVQSSGEWISFSLPYWAAYGVYGVGTVDRVQHLNEVSLQADRAMVYVDHALDKLYAVRKETTNQYERHTQSLSIAYFSESMLWKPFQQLRVVVEGDRFPASLFLMGYVAEPRGKTVS